MDFGLSFSPNATDKPRGQGEAGPGATPIQDAIKTLSLRIPQFRGPGGIAPMPLLNSPGGMQAPQMGHQMPGQPQLPNGLQQLFQQLFSGGGQGPIPNVIPGAGPSFQEQPQPYQPPSQGPSYGFNDPQVPQQDNSGHFFPGNWGRG